MKREIKKGAAAREALMRGVNELADVVSVTLGPGGRNVIIENNGYLPSLTKDGVTVARQVYLQDPTENLGAQIILEAASKTGSVAGDGTTTSTVLARAIAQGAHNKITKPNGWFAKKQQLNVIDIGRGITRAVNSVVHALEKEKKNVDETLLMKVATISANGDEEIGKMAANAALTVGIGGSISIEKSNKVETYTEIKEGYSFNEGFVSPYLAFTKIGVNSIMENAMVLVVEGELKLTADWLNESGTAFLKKYINTANRPPLLIVADSFAGEFLNTIAINVSRGQVQVCLVKAPSFGHRRKNFMRDLCVFTGAQLIGEESGVRHNKVTFDHCGRAEKIIVTAKSCSLLNEPNQKVLALIETLHTQSQDEPADEAEHTKNRIAKLKAKSAIIYVGGQTETEASERKDRMDDAVRASTAAQEEGVLPGGGRAYIYAIDKMWASLSHLELNESEEVGVTVVAKALESPLWQIAENAGYNGNSVIETVKESAYIGEGFNAKTGEMVDLIAAGIVDPVLVVCGALKNAAAAANSILVAEATLTYIPKQEEGLL